MGTYPVLIARWTSPDGATKLGVSQLLDDGAGWSQLNRRTQAMVSDLVQRGATRTEVVWEVRQAGDPQPEEVT